MNSRDKLKRTRQIKRAVMERMKLTEDDTGDASINRLGPTKCTDHNNQVVDCPQGGPKMNVGQAQDNINQHTNRTTQSRTTSQILQDPDAAYEDSTIAKIGNFLGLEESKARLSQMIKEELGKILKEAAPDALGGPGAAPSQSQTGPTDRGRMTGDGRSPRRFVRGSPGPLFTDIPEIDYRAPLGDMPVGQVPSDVYKMELANEPDFRRFRPEFNLGASHGHQGPVVDRNTMQEVPGSGIQEAVSDAKNALRFTAGAGKMKHPRETRRRLAWLAHEEAGGTLDDWHERPGAYDTEEETERRQWRMRMTGSPNQWSSGFFEGRRSGDRRTLQYERITDITDPFLWEPLHVPPPKSPGYTQTQARLNQMIKEELGSLLNEFNPFTDLFGGNEEQGVPQPDTRADRITRTTGEPVMGQEASAHLANHYQQLRNAARKAAREKQNESRLNQMIKEEFGKLMREYQNPSRPQDRTFFQKKRDDRRHRRQEQEPRPVSGFGPTPEEAAKSAGEEISDAVVDSIGDLREKQNESRLNQMIREELQSLGAPPASYDELLDGLKAVTQALSDVVGHGGGPYDHLISDLDYAKDLIGRSSKGTQLNEDWWSSDGLQRMMAYATGQGAEFDRDARVSAQSAAADRLGYYAVPDPNHDPHGAHAVNVEAGLASDSPLDPENVEDAVQRSAGGLRGYSQEGERCRDGTIRDGDEICESQDPFERMSLQEDDQSPYIKGGHPYRNSPWTMPYGYDRSAVEYETSRMYSRDTPLNRETGRRYGDAGYDADAAKASWAGTEYEYTPEQNEAGSKVVPESQDPFERMKEIALKPYGTHKYKD